MIGKIKEVTYIARCDLHTKRNDSRYGSMDRDLGSQRGEQAEFMPQSASLFAEYIARNLFIFRCYKRVRATFMLYISPKNLRENCKSINSPLLLRNNTPIIFRARLLLVPLWKNREKKRYK